jgi:hypothetical protein
MTNPSLRVGSLRLASELASVFTLFVFAVLVVFAVLLVDVAALSVFFGVVVQPHTTSTLLESVANRAARVDRRMKR